jgi:hypothetical protein
MSDIDDLEDIAEQCRYGGNNPMRGVSKRVREAFKRGQQHGCKENRSIEKQQKRGLERRERRRMLAKEAESGTHGVSEVPIIS